MAQTCLVCGQSFEVSPAELDFLAKRGIPLPVECPRDRLKALVSFRNRMNLFTAKCALTGKQIFSSFRPDAPYVVYDIDAWESDAWDGLTWGRDYDFSRSFFEQFAELFHSVPLPNLAVLRSSMENSDYTNGITSAKNCYLLFAASFNEDCLFSKLLVRCRDVVDCILANDSELCFSCENINNCYGLRYSRNCQNCSDSAFLSDCVSCKNCFRCVNLYNKEFHFENRPLAKAEYQAKMKEIDLGSFAAAEREKEIFEKFAAGFPVKYFFGRRNEDSTGNYLQNTKHCRESFFINNAEHLENCLWLDNSKSSFFHCMYGNGSELIYNSITCGDNAYGITFGVECWPGANSLEYCAYVGYGSSNCFGCAGLKKKSYCIFNKQYSKNEYLELRERIKKQMMSRGEYGRFFPRSMSPFEYNRSDAIEFFPIAEQQARREGFAWAQEEPAEGTGGAPLPDNIRDAADNLLKETFVCAHSKRKYRIIRQELEFYRRHNIPLPRVHPLERLKARSAIQEIHALRKCACGNCAAALETAYPPQRVVYCEDCYQKVVF